MVRVRLVHARAIFSIPLSGIFTYSSCAHKLQLEHFDTLGKVGSKPSQRFILM